VLFRSVAHDKRRIVASLTPVAASKANSRVIEPDPTTSHQGRVHQNEPAIGAELGRARLAGHISGDAECGANTAARTFIHHPAHHVHHHAGGPLIQRPPGPRCKLGDDLPIPVLDPRNQDRLSVDAHLCERGVRRNHFEKRDLAGSQGDRRHGTKLALIDPHSAGESRDITWPYGIHELRGYGVLRVNEPLAQRHLATGHRLACISRTPDVSVGNRNLDLPVDEPVLRGEPLLDGPRIDERLERGARLPARETNMIVLIFFEVTASYPGLDVAGGWLDGYKTHLHPCF